MKKRLLFLMVSALVALTASAQLHVTVFQPTADSISINSAAVATYPSGISGIFSHSLLYKATGDTAFTQTSTVASGTYPFWRRLYGLSASTDYEVRAIVTKSGISDTSASRYFRTKDTILPQPMNITNILVNPGLQQTRVSFHYRFVPYQADVNFWYQGYQYHTDPPIRLGGEGDTSILVTTPNVPGTTYSSNVLYAVPVGNVSGVNPDSSFTAPNYTVATQQSPDVEYAIITAIGEDSMVLTASIKTGNTGTANVAMDFLSGTGAIIPPSLALTITHDTIVTWKKKPVATFTEYAFRVKASNGGIDSAQTPFTRTKQVPLPSFGAIDTVNAGFNSTRLTVVVSTNGLPSWQASTTKFWATWTDTTGAHRTSDTIFGITATQTVTSSLLTKLFEYSIVNYNYIMLYAQNEAGMVSQEAQIRMVRRKSGFTLSWGSAQPTGFTTGTATNLTYNIAAGTTGTGIVKLTKIAPVAAPPVLRLAGANLTLNGTISLVSLTGLDTGATYSIQLLGASQDQDTVANSDIRYFTTWSVKGPKIGAFTATVIGVDSLKMVSIDTMGNTGTMQLEYSVCDSNDVLLYQLPSTLVTSPTVSAHSISKTNLEPGTKYVLKHKVTAINAPADTARIVVYTARIPDASVSVTSTTTQSLVNFSFAISTNGSWGGSIVDSLVVFDNGGFMFSIDHPIGMSTAGTFPLSMGGFNPGSVHTFTGYVKNHAGYKTYFTITDTLVNPDPAATATLGLADAYPARIVLRNCTYNVPVNSADYKVLHRMVYPNQLAWDTIPQGLKSGSGNFNDIVIAPLDVLSSYEIKIWSRNASGVTWETAPITVATLAAQQCKVNFVTANYNTNSVWGEVKGNGNGTNSEASEQLFSIVNGASNLLEFSNPVAIGTEEFTISYTHALPSIGYYEERGKVAKVGDINPHSMSKFFNNTALGVEEVDFDKVIRPMILSSAYSYDGKLLASHLYLKDLQEELRGQLVIVVPDDPYYAKEFKGKFYQF